MAFILELPKMNPILFSRIFNSFNKHYSITLLKFHSAAHKFDSKVIHPGVTSILVERDHCDLPPHSSGILPNLKINQTIWLTNLI